MEREWRWEVGGEREREREDWLRKEFGARDKNTATGEKTHGGRKRLGDKKRETHLRDVETDRNRVRKSKERLTETS